MSLRARKSANYCYCDGWKSDNFREQAIQKKQRTDNKKVAKRIKNDNFTCGNREKFEWLDGNITISYIGGSNNIFAYCLVSVETAKVPRCNYLKVVFLRLVSFPG